MTRSHHHHPYLIDIVLVALAVLVVGATALRTRGALAVPPETVVDARTVDVSAGQSPDVEDDSTDYASLVIDNDPFRLSNTPASSGSV
jgi:hypothetical protein